MDLAEKMKAALKSSKSEGSGNGSASKPSPEVVAAAEAIKVKAVKTPPATNPPEHGNAVDPDSAEGKTEVKVAAGDRMQIVTFMASAIVSSRVFSTDDGRAPVKIARLAIEIADAVIAELAKGKK
jgi:hypothetical protein